MARGAGSIRGGGGMSLSVFLLVAGDAMACAMRLVLQDVG